MLPSFGSLLALQCILLVLVKGQAFERLRARNSAHIAYRIWENSIKLIDTHSAYTIVIQAGYDSTYRTASNDPRTSAWCLVLTESGMVDWDRVDVLPGPNHRRTRHPCDKIMVVMPRYAQTYQPSASMWLTQRGFFEAHVHLQSWLHGLCIRRDQYSVTTIVPRPLKRDDSVQDAMGTSSLDDLAVGDLAEYVPLKPDLVLPDIEGTD